MAEFELLSGVSAVAREEWNGLVRDGSPFLEWDWLASLEEAGTVGRGTGWHPQPLVAREEGRIVAAVPLYLKEHSEGEFVFDWGWADAAENAGIRYYPKMLVGVPFTPVSGARALVAEGLDREKWTRELGAALRQLCDRNQLSGVHVCFCSADEVPLLQSAGYELRIGVQYHWRNQGYTCFDDYLEQFRSKRRNQIQRERRAMQEQGVEIEVRVGAEIPESLFPHLYRFYRATVDKKTYGRRYLNSKFFELVCERFRERVCAVIARVNGEPIAGTFNVQKAGVLYGRYWGARTELRHLHFNVAYYAAVEHCIAQGFTSFEPGAGGEFKRSRGFDAQPVYSAHYLRDPRLAQAVSRFLAAEREEANRAIDWLQEHSSLKS